MKTETLDGAKSPARRDEEATGLRAPLGWWNRSRDFLTRVREEMKRVTWPSRKEVYATTVVVILTSVFFGLYLFGVDLLLNAAVQRIFQRFGAA
ncbi:MAG: preprotein translocase subunit SecE [Vicinamibacterales bacterium]